MHSIPWACLVPLRLRTSCALTTMLSKLLKGHVGDLVLAKLLGSHANMSEVRDGSTAFMKHVTGKLIIWFWLLMELKEIAPLCFYISFKVFQHGNWYMITRLNWNICDFVLNTSFFKPR